MQASQTASLPPTPGLLDTGSKVDGLARKHAAEVASLREAFHARLAALEEELQVHVLPAAPSGPQKTCPVAYALRLYRPGCC